MIRSVVREQTRIDAKTGRLLLGLLVVDAAFLIIHAAHVRFDTPGSGLWLISRDRGFPEIFQYLKEASVVAVTIWLHRTRRSPVYLAWSLVFCYLLLDDSLRIHEVTGEWLANALDLRAVAGIDARDLGQVAVSASAGVVLLGLVALATTRDRSPARAITAGLGLAVAGLAVFGVVTDVIDAIDLFGLVEDGGEMVVMSFAAAFAVHHARTVATEPAR